MNILVLVAHSDDETIGLGGTIAKHVLEGHTVYCKYFTDGVSSREENKENQIAKLDREKSSILASKIIGFKWLENSNYPDNKMDIVPLLKIVKEIEKIKELIKPEIIYTHSPSDLNIDHRIITESTLTAFRPKAEETFQEIRLFEVSSATDYGHKSITDSFNPNLYIDISKTWEIKLKALKAYSNEMNKAPNSRSIEGINNLAKYRGSQSGLFYAEAFEVIRKIIR